MIELLTKLKSPDLIDIASIRNYWDNTPSVTWILSMIDSYEPNSEEIEVAMERWTRIHKDIENILSSKQIITIQEPRFIKWFLPLAQFLLPQEKSETAYLETYIKIPWVFWWTIDYYKEKVSWYWSVVALKDFKSCLKIPSLNSFIYKKYRLQVVAYSNLLSLNYVKNKMDANIWKWLAFIIDNNISQFYNVDKTYDDSLDFSIILYYYHYCNKSLMSIQFQWYMQAHWHMQDALDMLCGVNNHEYPTHINDFILSMRALNTIFGNLNSNDRWNFYRETLNSIEYKPSSIINFKQLSIENLNKATIKNKKEKPKVTWVLDSLRESTLNNNSPF